MSSQRPSVWTEGQKGQRQSDRPRLALTVGETRSQACGRPLDTGEGKARDGPVEPPERNSAPLAS